MNIDLDQIQKDIIENKKRHNWAIGDIKGEFCYLYGEVAEAYDAYHKNMPREELGSELADIAIYLLGLSDMLGFSLADEINKKMEINAHRKYMIVDGKEIKVDDRTLGDSDKK